MAFLKFHKRLIFFKGKTVTIKLKTVEFELKTRGKTLGIVTNQQGDIYSAARDLLKIEIQNCQPQPLRLRLMGNFLECFC